MAKIHEHRNMSPMAMFLHAKIDESGKTQRQIAEEVGFDRPNMISMLKHGESRVPFERIPALAKALDADLGYMMRLGIEQHWPGMLATIIEVLGNTASQNEARLLEALRGAFREADPSFSPEEVKAVVAVLVGLRSSAA